jgi:hypothetical protein
VLACQTGEIEIIPEIAPQGKVRGGERVPARSDEGRMA